MQTANCLPPYPLRKLLLLFLPPSAPRGCRVGDAMGFLLLRPFRRGERGERQRGPPAGSGTHPTGEPTCLAPCRAAPRRAQPLTGEQAPPSGLALRWLPPFPRPLAANAPPPAEKPPALPPSSEFDWVSSAPPWWEENEPSSALLSYAGLRACINSHALANTMALKGAVALCSGCKWSVNWPRALGPSLVPHTAS